MAPWSSQACLTQACLAGAARVAIFARVQIALLRGVNLGGRRAVAMAALRNLLTGLGCADVRTLLQSGNVVFSGGQGSGAALERWLEAALLSELGLTTDVMVRSSHEWRRLIAANPFPDEAKRDPARFLVVCLKGKPTTRAINTLRAAITGPERLEAVGRELYVVYPAGQGQSRLTVALMDAKLGIRGTGRNWNTVLKLGALVA
jgi:uncharacterized protein (DUF1697 family)